MQVDTSSILFICGGAFAGIDKIIQQRSERSGIGFSAQVRSKDENKNIGEIFKKIEPDDLVKFGLIPEFVGRLPVIATLEELDEDSLVEILSIFASLSSFILESYSTLNEKVGLRLL